MAVLRKPYFLCILILLNSCRQRVGNESFQVTKDGNGNLQSEIHYINDTVIHGLAKYYYYPNPKNILKDEIEFNHGVKNGWHKHYSKDGNLGSKIHWKDGLQDGETIWYYENGTNVKSESFWVKGKAYGAAKWFYKNGNLASINVTDFLGAVMYVIQYDEQGNKTKEEGVVFSPKFFFLPSQDSIRENQIVNIKITVAVLPGKKTIIRMGELNKDSMKELTIENCTAIYKQAFTEAGKHTLITVGEIRDLQGNLMKRDSVAVSIVVAP